MSIKQPIYHEFDLNTTSGNSRVISLTHTDDAHVDVIELCVKQQGAVVDLTGAIVIARMVLHGTTDVLLNDNVSCAINSAGNILIPFDNAAIESRKGIVKIEVNITRSPDILTLQLPLWVKINGSILDDATVDPHSEGTIPELLEEVKEELERVKDFATAEDVFEILDSALEGNPSVAPTLLIDNTVDQQFNPDGHWIMYYIDSGDLRHNIFDFANLPSGTSDYSELENKPSINNVTLQGNKSSNDLRLQPLINNYFTVENNEYLSYDFNSVRAGVNSVLYCVPFERISNFPNSLVGKIIQSGNLYIFHYVHYAVGARYLIRRIMGYDLNAKYAEFAQYCTVGNENTVVSQTDWVELTGSGSQIVSGVVNQNGTITFTDSDGNTFTTTGTSVIGFSPTATVTQTQSGATVTITDKNGTTTANISNGADGQDYILTNQDKTDIANIVLQLLPTTQGVLYGNTSN